jgi:hypothetical protein
VSATMRLVGWQVTPIVMRDDGEHLEPVRIGAAMIPAREWQAFKDGGDEQALDQVRQQIEG